MLNGTGSLFDWPPYDPGNLGSQIVGKYFKETFKEKMALLKLVTCICTIVGQNEALVIPLFHYGIVMVKEMKM